MALYIVVGPPASGKSTWVNAHAKHGDIVVDYDRLAQALTAPGADAHRHTRAVQSVAHQARQGAITAALRHCTEVDVYIIHSTPRPEAMEKYARHGGEVVTIDPGRDVVLARCAEQRTAQARAAAMRWYDSADSEPITVSTSRTW